MASMNIYRVALTIGGVAINPGGEGVWVRAALQPTLEAFDGNGQTAVAVNPVTATEIEVRTGQHELTHHQLGALYRQQQNLIISRSPLPGWPLRMVILDTGDTLVAREARIMQAPDVTAGRTVQELTWRLHVTRLTVDFGSAISPNP